MALYEVTASRTESIMFVVDADSPEDAEARYLIDGDEVASKTVELSVGTVQLAESGD